MKIGFAMEQILGHVTHAQNLRRVIAASADVEPTYVDLPFENTAGRWSNLPLVRSKWSLRASLGAYLGMRPYARTLQAAFFHTHMSTLFSAGFMSRVPSVVSLDSPPFNSDETYYSSTESERVKSVKNRTYRRMFSKVKHVVVWSEWVKRNLVAHYEVSPERVSVIPPGIDLTCFKPNPRRKLNDGKVRLLFVGGAFDRKGGDLLLRWARETSASSWEVHLVTRDPVPDTPNVVVHRGISNNSPEIVQLYQQSDVFVLPTNSDCSPLACMEALASGLPIVSTRVGGIPEMVRDNETGYLLQPGDYPALKERLDALVADAGLRSTLGAAAYEDAHSCFDAAVNYRRLLETIKHVALEKPR